MTVYFSKSLNSFINDKLSKCEKPIDAIEINEDVYIELIKNQSNGKIISSNKDGFPVLIDPVGPNEIDLIKNEILLLENKITKRREREAILTEEGKAWLLGIENQIATLREGL